MKNNGNKCFVIALEILSNRFERTWIDLQQ